MAFSMHSHSGQFCPGHAKDILEDIVKTAISRGMQTFALTEHMPRDSEKDLYPEETDNGVTAKEAIAALPPRHEAFIIEALRLREKYASEITLLIGFEGEWIRLSYKNLVQDLASNPAVDFFIGSVHHVHGIPIDFDSSFYQKAIDAAGGTEERLFEDYFDSQFEMLKELKPRVVGHFDLIRLLSTQPNSDLRQQEGVWERAARNLRLIVEQGALMEINTSALRRGLEEPYPTKSICEEFLKMGGKLTLSDDSHGIAQVGTNYERAIKYVESLGVTELFTLNVKDKEIQDQNPTIRRVELASIKESFRA